ncbi:hypothetical protein MferCBS31731_001737 [Microsporum ferrugineum]
MAPTLKLRFSKAKEAATVAKLLQSCVSASSPSPWLAAQQLLLSYLRSHVSKFPPSFRLLTLSRESTFGRMKCAARDAIFESPTGSGRSSFIQDECINMGAPELAPYYLTAVDAVFDVGMAKCVPGNYHDANMCSSDFPLADVMECLQGNALRLIWEISSSIWPILSSNCQKQYDYITADNMCGKVLPTCAKTFAAEHCKAVV